MHFDFAHAVGFGEVLTVKYHGVRAAFSKVEPSVAGPIAASCSSLRLDSIRDDEEVWGDYLHNLK